MIGNTTDGTNFPHKLLLIGRQVARLCKAFACISLANMNLSKTQFSKIVQLAGFLGRRYGLLMIVGLPLTKNIFIPLAKSVLIT